MENVVAEYLTDYTFLIGYGFILATIIQLLSYGIFKAFKLLKP